MSSGTPPSYSQPGSYNQDPSKFPGFDSSGLSNSMIAASNQNRCQPNRSS